MFSFSNLLDSYLVILLFHNIINYLEKQKLRSLWKKKENANQ